MSDRTHTPQPKPRDNFRKWDDPAYNDLRRIFSEPKMREVLTHDSFYKSAGDDRERKKESAHGNGRYVFAGMTVFKGQVAEILFKFFSGSGTQLQHILGNLFKNDYLTQLFDRWKLSGRVRCGEGFDVAAHRHIFVYAIFGYVSTLDESTRNWFIFKFILNDETRYIFEHHLRNNDIFSQADYLVKQTDGRRLKIEMSLTEDGLHCATAMLSDGTVLCEATSKSWQYARRKVSKMALNILATPGRKALLSNPDYQERIRREEEERIAARKAEIAARDEAKAEARRKKEEELAEIKKLRDAKRRKSQAEAKARKAANAARAAAKAAKEARPMSAKKRRHLEDKAK